MNFHYNSTEENYRVILQGIGSDSEEEIEQFCKEVSGHYGFPFHLMEKIAKRCPIVIKRDLTFRKAKLLAIAFKSFGASVTIEKKRYRPPISLEFTTGEKRWLELESSHLSKSPGGSWQLFGRVKNISVEELSDIWVMIQLFNEFGELIALEEAPLLINLLPPGESSPFKVIFEGILPFQKISIVFKSASGNPIPAKEEKKRKWIEVDVPRFEKRDLSGPTSILSEAVMPSIEPQTAIPTEKEEMGWKEEVAEWASESISLIESENSSPETAEPIETREEALVPDFLEEGSHQEEPEISGRISEEETSEVIRDLIQEEEQLHLDYPTHEKMEEPLAGEPNPPPFELVNRVGTEGPSMVEARKTEEPILYPWLEDFRKAIDAHGEVYSDPIGVWFEQVQKEGDVGNIYHLLFMILVYYRFNQTDSLKIALENTKKVFKISLEERLSLEGIPSLKGTPFFSDDAWRELYFRAIPRIKEVSSLILEKSEWKLTDLDRLIRIIPHMTEQNSLRAIRFIHQSIPAVIVDISQIPVDINEGLYRVASRLGVVNPLFDYYQGKNSMGDLKIQSFARSAFHDDPGKVEDPMGRIGSVEEDGPCLPIEPQCGHCQFGSFCKKLFLGFNPSERGFIGQA